MSRLFAALVALVALAPLAEAQTVADIDRLDAAVIDAWQKTPLTMRRAIFVAGDPNGYGQYQERPNNVFKAGEKLIVYAEPVGYAWKDAGGGLYDFGLAVDLSVKAADGKMVGEQKDFANLELKSHARNQELMVALTLTLTGAPAGDYVLEYKLRDIASPKTATISLPFKIAG